MGVNGLDILTKGDDEMIAQCAVCGGDPQIIWDGHNCWVECKGCHAKSLAFRDRKYPMEFSDKALKDWNDLQKKITKDSQS